MLGPKEFQEAVAVLHRDGFLPSQASGVLEKCATFQGRGTVRGAITEAKATPTTAAAAWTADVYLAGLYDGWSAFSDPTVRHSALEIPSDRRHWLTQLTNGKLGFLLDTNQEFSFWDTNFARTWEHRDELSAEFFGRVLVELGGGEGTILDCLGENVAASVPYSVNVDICHRFIEPHSNPHWDDPALHRRGAPARRGPVVRADMLTFLKAMTSQCRWFGHPISFSLNGIDNCVIPSDDYHRALAEEIARIATHETRIFVCESDVAHYLPEHGFVSTSVSRFDDSARIWRRKAQSESG